MSITHLDEQTATADRARGISWLGHPRVFGTLIGAAGASSLVWGGKDALGNPWSTIAVLAWAAAMTAYLVWALAMPRPFPPLQVAVEPA